MGRGRVAWFMFLISSHPALAGDIKIHQWPIEFTGAKVVTLDVSLDVGYYAHVVDQGPIQVIPDPNLGDPLSSFSGCKVTDVLTNFPAVLDVAISQVGPYGGQWHVTAQPKLIYGKEPVNICAFAKYVNLWSGDLDLSKDLRVAEISVRILPQ